MLSLSLGINEHSKVINIPSFYTIQPTEKGYGESRLSKMVRQLLHGHCTTISVRNSSIVYKLSTIVKHIKYEYGHPCVHSELDDGWMPLELN